MLSSSFYIAAKFGNKFFDRFRETSYYWSSDKSFLLMQYLARFVAVRQRFAQQRQSVGSIIKKYSATSQVHLSNNIEAIVDTLFQDGYYQGLKLSEGKVQAFLDYAFTHPCYANRDRRGDPIYLTPELIAACPKMPYRVASYIHHQENSSLIKQLARDPQLLAIAEAYLGRAPVYHKSELIWSFPHQQSSANCFTHFFHSDINDYRNIKFFFYLTDVDETSGPHHYIEGSHVNRPLIGQLRAPSPSAKTSRKLAKLYGKDAIKTVTGPAGYGFIGDPYSLHRGSDTAARPRLFLQIEFIMSQYRCWYYKRN
ncbi:MAG: phytanoyl-CoA dioxygenase family protein [Cyanobacteria bacterium P01_C01_bin.120]